MRYKNLYLRDGCTVHCLGARGENEFLGVILPIFCQALAAERVEVGKSLVYKKVGKLPKCLMPGCFRGIFSVMAAPCLKN